MHIPHVLTFSAFAFYVQAAPSSSCAGLAPRNANNDCCEVNQMVENGMCCDEENDLSAIPTNTTSELVPSLISSNFSATPSSVPSAFKASPNTNPTYAVSEKAYSAKSGDLKLISAYLGVLIITLSIAI